MFLTWPSPHLVIFLRVCYVCGERTGNEAIHVLAITLCLSVYSEALQSLKSDMEGKFVGLERAVLDTRSVGINTAYELQKLYWLKHQYVNNKLILCVTDAMLMKSRKF